MVDRSLELVMDSGWWRDDRQMGLVRGGRQIARSSGLWRVVVKKKNREMEREKESVFKKKKIK